MIKVNINNQDSILKKLLRQEKRKTLKRKRDEVDNDNETDDINKTIDKDSLIKAIEEKNYDIGLHFSKKLAFELEKKTKARSFQTLPIKSKT